MAKKFAEHDGLNLNQTNQQILDKYWTSGMQRMCS